MQADDEVPRIIQIQIIQQELQMWKNTRWQLEMRHRVTKRIGGDLKAIEEEMVRAEGALDELKAILNEIESQAS
jgi:hypothetical protein